MSRSASANLPRGLQLVLAPNELGLGNPPSCSSFSPSPLNPGQPPTPESASANSPSPILTPNSLSRGKYPDLARPPLSGPAMLQLPPMAPPPGPPICIIPIAGSEAAGVGGDVGLGQGGGVPERPKPSAKEEGSWRRHMSLEMDALASLSSSPPACPAHGDHGLGKSLSVQDLLQPAVDAGPALFPGSRHSGGDWGETELFISDKDLDARGESFSFLSCQTAEAGLPSPLLRTGGGAAGSPGGSCKAAGSSESLSLPHVRLK